MWTRSAQRQDDRVHDIQLGRSIRALRRRRVWRQADLAVAAGVSRSLISLIERGQIDDVRISRLRAIARALEGSIAVDLRWRGAALDRLVDARHAALASAAIATIGSTGWMTQPEVSYSHYGERGSIDILAWHPEARALLVIENKSELTSIGATLRKLDEKARLAPAIAGDRVGWRPATVSRMLILVANTTNRRRVREHDRVLRAALPGRADAVRAWIRAPRGPIAGILFVPIDPVIGVGHSSAGPARVRTRNPSVETRRLSDGRPPSRPIQRLEHA
jgi:transcriptional regulator with XRE-family HTH domain